MSLTWGPFDLFIYLKKLVFIMGSYLILNVFFSVLIMYELEIHPFFYVDKDGCEITRICKCKEKV